MATEEEKKAAEDRERRRGAFWYVFDTIHGKLPKLRKPRGPNKIESRWAMELGRRHEGAVIKRYVDLIAKTMGVSTKQAAMLAHKKLVACGEDLRKIVDEMDGLEEALRELKEALAVREGGHGVPSSNPFASLV